MAWAELTDARCYYELIGRGGPLLLIPGLGVTCRIWDPIVAELARRFTVILVDNRGIGRSAQKRKPCTLRDFSSDLVELLDHLQLDRSHVLGLSLGGVIAQRLAVDHPSRIDRLVLVSCSDIFTPYLRQVSTMLGHTLMRMRAKAFARMVEVLGTSPRFIDSRPDAVEERVLEKCAQGIPARAIGRQLRCLAAEHIDLEHNLLPAPTLVLAGEYDFLIPGCYAREMAGRIPGGQFLLIPDAGHNPLLERPEIVLPRMVDFLNGRPVASITDADRLSACPPAPVVAARGSDPIEFDVAGGISR